MKSHVTWALAGASVVLLGFTSMQFTDAAWSSSESSDADTIRTGHLRITDAGQLDFDLSGLHNDNMNTGNQAQIPLVVQNDSTVPVDYRLVGVGPMAGSTPPALDLRVARVDDQSQCPAGDEGPFGTPGELLYDNSITGASTGNHLLDVSGPNSTDVLCLTTTAPAVSPGQSGKYVFTFRADQK